MTYLGIRTEDIRKLSDFRQNATAHLDRLAESGRVEVLTVNGEARGVVMSPQVFDELIARAELATNLAAINRGVADMKAGRYKSLKDAFGQVAAKKGLKFNP